MRRQHGGLDGIWRRGRFATAVLAIVALAGLASPPAVADTPIESSDEAAVEFLESNMDRFDVPEDKRPGLIDKVLNGDPLDADLPGSQPTTTEAIEVDGGTFPISRYADGSFVSSGVEEFTEIEEGSVQPRSVSGCTRTGSSGGYTYKDCKVSHSTLSHSMWFYATFSQASNAASIGSVWGRQFESAQTCSIDSFGITQKNGTNGDPAMATFWMTCHDAWSGSSGTEYLGLRVTGSSYYTVQSF